MKEKPEQTGGILDQIWEIFSSMKTGLLLLGLLALASGLGTFLPVGNIYSAAWFKLLLGLLGVNLLVCTIQRWPGVYRQAFKPRLPAAKASLAWKNRRELAGGADELQAAVRRVFTRGGYVLTAEEKEGCFRFIARKRRLGYWGSLFVHLSFIVLLAGVLIGSFSGVKGYFMAGTGATVALQDIELSKGTLAGQDFQIRINATEERVLPNGELDNWYSDLSIMENGREVLRGTIAVNHPLSYRGFVFYQARFAAGAAFTVTGRGEETPFILVENGGNYFQVPGQDLYVLAGSLDRTAADSSIVYQVLKDRGAAVQKMGRLKPGQTEEIQSGIRLSYHGPAGFTGIQIKKDPGIPLVWLAFGLLLLGLFLIFYWRPLTLKGLIPEGSSCLQLGSESGKLPGRAETEAELDRQVANLRNFLAENRKKDKKE